MEQAGRKIHNRINGKVVYSFPTDAGFVEEVWENIRSIIGESRFQELQQLSTTKINRPLLYFGIKRCLPYIEVSVYYLNENEKRVISHVLKNTVALYLNLYGYCTQILTNWTIRHDLSMPVLSISYARNDEERRKLKILYQYMQKKINDKNNYPTDDETGENLYG